MFINQAFKIPGSVSGAEGQQEKKRKKKNMKEDQTAKHRVTRLHDSKMMMSCAKEGVETDCPYIWIESSVRSAKNERQEQDGNLKRKQKKTERKGGQ